MSGARALVIALFLLFGGTAFTAAESDAAALAADARARAETALAEGRAARMQAHAERLETMRALRAELATLRTEQERLDAERNAAVRAQQERRTQHATLERANHDLLEALAKQSGLDAVAILAADETRVRSQARARVAELAAMGQVQRHDATIIDRAGQRRTVPVLRLGAIQAWALGDDPGAQGLLRPGPGDTAVLDGPALDAAAQQAIAGGGIPVDPSRRLAGMRLPSADGIGDWLRLGGPFVWPILALLLAAIALIAERVWALFSHRAPTARSEELLGMLDRQGAEAVAQAVAARRSPLERVLAAGMAVWDADRETREAAFQAALISEEQHLTRSLRLIAVAAAAAPLLGLLGTVTGMIETFAVIASEGSGDPRLLSGGISQALITTQLGLLVAVPILIAHALLGRIAERRSNVLEAVCTAALGSHTPGASDRPASHAPPVQAGDPGDG